MKRPYRRNIQPKICKFRGICTSELYTLLDALMSTKSTIASSDNFHFYHEVFDDDHVYLRLDTTHFEAGYGSVMVRIPIHIWETIRHLAGMEFDLLDKEDDDLLAMVESNVDQRLAKLSRKFAQHSGSRRIREPLRVCVLRRRGYPAGQSHPPRHGVFSAGTTATA
jgi:hypothetical protein